MALEKNCNTKMKCAGLNTSDVDAADEELGVVRFTGAMGKKRILMSNYKRLHGSSLRTPMKKSYSARLNSKGSILEALPQDILVRILCGVEHEDLDQLFQVSKSLREATLIAKNWHFAFCTPSSKTSCLRPFSDLDDESKLDIKDAPKQQRRNRSQQMSGKRLADITIALFHSPEGEQWSRRERCHLSEVNYVCNNTTDVGSNLHT